MNLIFEEELKNKQNQKILGFLNRINDLSKEEKHQLKLITLWESIKSYDSSKGCVFSTHLYNRCRFKYLKHINQRKQPIFCFVDRPDICQTKILDNLPILFKTILKDRFVYNYSVNELISMYNLKRWQITILIDDSKKKLKEILND